MRRGWWRPMLLTGALAVVARGAMAPGERAAALAAAVDRLHAAAHTAAGVAAVATLCDELAAGPDDEPGRAARYLRARIDLNHASPVDPRAAEARFAALWRDAGASDPWGRQAAVQWVVLRLTATPLTARERAVRLEETAAVATALAGRPEAAAVQLVRARALHRFDAGPAERLAAVVAAVAAGVRNPEGRADALMEAGWLARELGRWEEARRYLDAFLAEFPVDARARLVRDMLAGLPTTGGEAAP